MAGVNQSNNQQLTLNVTTTQAALNNSGFQGTYSTKATQQAQSLTTSLSLPWDSASAKNITNLVNDLAYQVQNTVSQTCLSNLSQSAANVANVTSSTTGVIVQTNTQIASSISSCVQNNSNVTTAQVA